jgi:hypothetical protein
MVFFVELTSTFCIRDGPFGDLRFVPEIKRLKEQVENRRRA